MASLDKLNAWDKVKYKECKQWRCAWYEVNNAEPVPEWVYDRYTLHCDRCGSDRLEYIDRNGDRIGGLIYRRPDDYKDEKGVKPSRAVMRLLLHNHSIPRGVV